MNNDAIKEKLLELNPDVEDFTVILSGKQSKKVNGLYKPITREIILHNKNFESDNEMMFTAIHEFAHHIQFTQTQKPVTARVHTTDFWEIFHSLLYEAERRGIHENVFRTDPEFLALTERIKTEFIARHGELIQAFGEVLLSAHELCDKHRVSFGDYVNRVLKLPHTQAYSLIRLSNLELNPTLGYENMKALAAIRDPDRRRQAEQDLGGDYSPTMIKLKYGKKHTERDPVAGLKAEKKRLESTIVSLKKRLAYIEEKIKELEAGEGASSQAAAAEETPA